MTMYTNDTNSKILGNFYFSVGVVVGLAMTREAGCRFSSYQCPIKTLQVQDAAGRYPYVGCPHIMSGCILPYPSSCDMARDGPFQSPSGFKQLQRKRKVRPKAWDRTQTELKIPSSTKTFIVASCDKIPGF